jgi:ankyrin repeat protein
MAPIPTQTEIDDYVTAARLGDVTALTAFVDKFGVEHIDDCNSDGHPALSTAAGDKHEVAAMMLLERGASISFAGLRGTYSPLIMAASRGLPTLARVLLELGADVNERLALSHHTPLHYAVMNGHKEVALMLLAYGANIAATTKDGWHVLQPDQFADEHPDVQQAVRDWKAADRDAWHVAHSALDPATSSGMLRRIAQQRFGEQAQMLTEGLPQEVHPVHKIVLTRKGHDRCL